MRDEPFPNFDRLYDGMNDQQLLMMALANVICERNEWYKHLPTKHLVAELVRRAAMPGDGRNENVLL